MRRRDGYHREAFAQVCIGSGSSWPLVAPRRFPHAGKPPQVPTWHIQRRLLVLGSVWDNNASLLKHVLSSFIECSCEQCVLIEWWVQVLWLFWAHCLISHCFLPQATFTSCIRTPRLFVLFLNTVCGTPAFHVFVELAFVWQTISQTWNVHCVQGGSELLGKGRLIQSCYGCKRGNFHSLLVLQP